MSNFYHELDLESVLQCPVCFELPSDVIIVCKVGHHMCNGCRKRLTTCPTCQSPLTSTRNFLAEALISKFSIFKGSGDDPFYNNSVATSGGGGQCAQADSSTPSAAILQDNPDQLQTLPMASGLYHCLLESCRNRKPIGSGLLYSHMRSSHQHLFDKFQNKTSTFKSQFKFCLIKEGKQKFHRAIHVSNMGIFFLSLDLLSDDYLNCWISAPVPTTMANNFQYQVQFSKEDDDEGKITFVSKVGSSLHNTQWMLERGRVMIIPPSSHHLTRGHFFNISIKIVYNPPSTPPSTPPATLSSYGIAEFVIDSDTGNDYLL